jgi:hypothetical protein
MLFEKRFEEQDSSQNISFIHEFFFKKKFYDQFKENTFKALQKFPSSVKTRTVHKIIENNLITFGFFGGKLTNKTCSFIQNKELTKIYKIGININFENDIISIESVKDFIYAQKSFKKINDEKTIITKYQIQNLKKLHKEYDSFMEKALQNIDYFNLIDILYFDLLELLVVKIFKNKVKEINKILELNSSIISELIKKIYLKSTKKYLNKDQEIIVDIIADFFILTFYKNDGITVAIKKLEKLYDKEYIEVFKRISNLKIESFLDINRFLSETNISKISDSLFKIQTRKFLGELGLKFIDADKAKFDAFLSSIRHKNNIFNITPFITERKLKKLEDIILIEKGNLVFAESQIKFFDDFNEF